MTEPQVAVGRIEYKTIPPLAVFKYSIKIGQWLDNDCQAADQNWIESSCLLLLLHCCGIGNWWRIHFVPISDEWRRGRRLSTRQIMVMTWVSWRWLGTIQLLGSIKSKEIVGSGRSGRSRTIQDHYEAASSISLKIINEDRRRGASGKSEEEEEENVTFSVLS